MGDLKEKEKHLELMKDHWEKQMAMLQKRLTTPQTGNDFVTGAWRQNIMY